mmetsp:Transcript_80659/g.215302  ORF Transcript_80659/g.215302 Transcript_80659/m.215302 type:complete len:88 (+) Transcript_80659:74-337(+)
MVDRRRLSRRDWLLLVDGEIRCGGRWTRYRGRRGCPRGCGWWRLRRGLSGLRCHRYYLWLLLVLSLLCLKKKPAWDVAAVVVVACCS